MRFVPLRRTLTRWKNFPWDLMRKGNELGLMTYALPEAYGGAGVESAVTSSVVTEELAWGCAGVASRVGRHGAVRDADRDCGDARAKNEISDTPLRYTQMPLGAYAITEPNAGSDVASMKTTTRKVSGGYVLNGTKQFITNGGLADVYIVFATIDPSRHADGICAFIVDKDMGVKPGKKEKKMGHRASHTAQIHFEDVFVPEENLLGEEGEGFFIAMRTFEHTRPDVASMAIAVTARGV